MKKVVLGLVVLILLTPFIIAKIANSNIDEKIRNFQQMGINIKEVKKDIGYLSTQRIFEVEFNQNTNQKNWNLYKKLIDKTKFEVTLNFKNLPITKAVFDLKIHQLVINNINFLNGLEIHIESKDFKKFDYFVKDYITDKVVVEKVKGHFVNKKYSLNNVKMGYIETPLFVISNGQIDSNVKDLNLGIMEVNGSADKWELIFDDIKLMGKNSNETFKVKLKSNNKYFVEDIFKSKAIGVEIDYKRAAIADVVSDFHIKGLGTDLVGGKLLWNLKWNNSEIKKVIVDGGELNVSADILTNILESDFVDNNKILMDLFLEDNLFKKITNKLDPQDVKKYFNNHRMHIELNKEVFINGNRIQ